MANKPIIPRKKVGVSVPFSVSSTVAGQAPAADLILGMPPTTAALVGLGVVALIGAAIYVLRK